MNETNTINAIVELFTKSSKQLNNPHECDSELVSLTAGNYAFNIDEFSEEDGFCETDLELLGKNLAVATISDLLASGAVPKYFLQAICEPTDREGFSIALSMGISQILKEVNCFLLGGDIGVSKNWHYTGVAIGECQKSLTRRCPNSKQKLWVTGKIYDGNLSALDRKISAQFEGRLKEAEKIREVATACIDTSGGLVEAVNTLAQVNPHHSFYLQSHLVPFAPQCVEVANTLALPLAGFAFAGAGEYELLFLTDKQVEGLDFATEIGYVIPDTKRSQIFWDEKLLPPTLPTAREYRNREEYLGKLLEVIRG